MPKNPESEGSRLVNLKEIEQEHGVSRSALHTYRRSASFPQPIPVEGSTKIQYRAEEVAAWFEANPKQQGRRTDLAVPREQGDSMSVQQPLRAVFTVTVKTRPDGDYYVDEADLARHVKMWIEGGLEDRDDITEVTVEWQTSADREVSA